MADETTPPKETTPQTDPFVSNLLKSFDKVLEPDPAAPTASTPMVVGANVGEQVLMTKEQEKAKEATPPAEGEKKTEEPKKPVEGEKKEPPKEEKPPEEPKVIRFKKKAPPVEPPPAKPQEETKPEPPPADETAYVETLTEEQRDELALAEYAERKGKAGVRTKTLDYFKSLDKWIADNPDASPDSEEFAEFVRENKPKWSESERRRMERQMIADEAAEKVRKELEPAVNEQKLKVRKMEVQPVIESAIEEVERALVSKPPGEGMEAIPDKVVTTLKKDGYEKALEQFPDEAPIVQGALTASKAWLEISNGVSRFNEANPTHAWLAQFIAQEGANMKRQPKEKTVRDGKAFLPLHEFLALKQTKPEELEKHWTYTDEDVVQLITDKAILSVNQRVSALKKAGWTRQPAKVSGEQGNPAAPPAAKPSAPAGEISSSPRAGSRSVPGATDQLETKSEFSAFLDQLIPDGSKIAGV